MRTVLRSAALQVVVLAMVLRALVPEGWMPNAEAGAYDAALMPCPGAMHDMAQMPGMGGMHHDMASMPGMHHETPPPPRKTGHAKSTYCACATVAQTGTPAPDVATQLPAPASIRVAYAAAHSAPQSVSPYRPNAARAPPLPA